MGKKRYNKIETPKPLKLINYMDKYFPGVWKTYDEVIDIINKDNILISKSMNPVAFRKICGGIAKDYLSKYGRYSEGNNTVDAHTIYVLGAWRKYKEIYSVDKDLADLLISGAEDINIPVKTLLNIPFPAFYIDVEGTDSYKENGFFVVLDKSSSELEFFTIDYNGDAIGMPLILDSNYTISEAINKMVGDGNNYYNISKHNENIEFIKKAVQLVLYICAVNADITENPQQKVITKKSTSTSKPKDVLREVRKWDVGYRVGRTIRLSKDVERKSITTSVRTCSGSSPKRPHVRRGHFHNFWVGSKANNTRELRLKWVAPTFINAKLDVELPATVNRVKE